MSQDPPNQLTQPSSRDALARNLTAGELGAYEYWRKSDLPKLGPDLNAKLFRLFLSGKDCSQIRSMNPAVSLGQVVAARIEGEWDRRRAQHLDRLLSETSERAWQATMEAAEFVCDLLTVADLEHGTKFRRYIQTENPDDLKGSAAMRVTTIADLKAAVGVLQALTGQDRLQKIEHKHEGEVTLRPGEPAKPVGGKEAGARLRALTAKVQE